MSFWAGDTALEVGTALARADLSDQQSFGEAVNIVKRYVRAKMQKYKSVAPALPGGKLEALERKYAPLGYQDVFYVVRLELALPASSLALPRPSDAVMRRLEHAGYPLPDEFADLGLPSSPVPTTAPSIHRSRSTASSWITEEDFAAGMPITREMSGLAAKSVKKSKKEAEILAAAALAVGAPPVPPLPNHSTLPPVPPAPNRVPSNPVPINGLGMQFNPDFKAPCGCLDHRPGSVHSHGHVSQSSVEYKLSAEASRVDSPTLPLSPRPAMSPLSEGGSSSPSVGLRTPSSPAVDLNRRHTADIRALFEALPPEAQAMAVQRLAETKQTDRDRAAAAAEKRRAAAYEASLQAADEQRERDRQLLWERAQARERELQSRERERRKESASHRRALEDQTRRELEKQRTQLIATQQLCVSPVEDIGAFPSATASPSAESPFQGFVDALPTPPPRVDEDARRMIEARIAALQSALMAMGVDPASPSLPPTPGRSPILPASPPRTFTQSSVAASHSSHISNSPLPSPIITTPRTPLPVGLSQSSSGRRPSASRGHETQLRMSKPRTPSHSHSPSQSQSQSQHHSHLPSQSHGSATASPVPSRVAPRQPSAFDLDEHIDSLCRAESGGSSQNSSSNGNRSHHADRHILPLTPAAIFGATRRPSPGGESRQQSPPPSYTLVDGGVQ